MMTVILDLERKRKIDDMFQIQQWSFPQEWIVESSGAECIG